MASRVILKRGKAGPVLRGYPWVFQGWIERVVGDPEDGDTVDVQDWRQSFVARGVLNSSSKIRVRCFSRVPDTPMDRDFLTRSIARAQHLRTHILRLSEKATAYRLFHSDGDGLSGLIVDRYADYLVVQFSSLMVDRHRDTIIEILGDRMGPQGIIERQDERARKREGLSASEGLLVGSPPPLPLEIGENGVRYLVDLPHGQKTGFFLDQRDNRMATAGYARGRRVLDAFCYTGGFGLAAARGGASEVHGFDSSSGAVALAARNARLNGLDSVTYEKGDAFRVLRQHARSGDTFGMVVLDPPKFSPTRQDRDKALRAYHEVNLQALRLISPEGILVTCACSASMQDFALEEVVAGAATDARREVQILERRGQGEDHPVPPYFPEGRYLTCLVVRVH